MRRRWSGRRRSWGSPPSASPTAIRWPAWCARITAAKEHKIRLLVGARLVTTDGFEAACYPTDRAAYGRLCRLLTAGNRRAIKGQCHFSFEEMIAASEGQIFIALPPRQITPAFRRAPEHAGRRRARPRLSRRHLRLRGDERRRLGELGELAARRARRSSPPTMPSTTTPAASRSPTCSPASARSARLPKPAIASRPTPSGT